MTDDYVKMENMHRMEIINGKKVLDEKKMEYENPFVKKIRGVKNGRKYSMTIQRRPKIPKRVTFRVWNPVYRNRKIERTLTPYYPTTNSLNMKKSEKCKTMKKKRRNKKN
jgi:hypothetical protein